MANFIKKVNKITPSWTEGDSLVFLPNTTEKTSMETFTLTSFENSVTFTVNGSSRFDHPSLSSRDYLPGVVNLSRNVSIRGTGTTSNTRGSVRIMKGANVVIANTQFSNIGSNKNQFAGVVIDTDSTGSVTLSNNSFIGDDYSVASYDTISNLSGNSFGNISIVDNTFYNSKNTSINLNPASASNLIIKDNIILSAGNYGIKCVNLNSNNVQIYDNSVVNSQSDGVFISNSENISGNLSALGSGTVSINNIGAGLLLSTNQAKEYNLSNVISRGNSEEGLFTSIPNITSLKFDAISSVNNTYGIVLSTTQLSAGTFTNIEATSNKTFGIHFSDSTDIMNASAGNISYDNCIISKNKNSGLFIDSKNERITNISNLTASNNKKSGISLSGDIIDYRNPISLTVNNVVLNNNNIGLELVNVAPNINTSEISNNNSYGIRLFNVPDKEMVFDGVSSINGAVTGIIRNGSPVVSLSSPFNNIDGSLYFDGTTCARYLTYSFPLSNIDSTIEFWVLPTADAQNPNNTTILGIADRGDADRLGNGMNGRSIKISQSLDNNGYGFTIPTGNTNVTKGEDLPVGKWTHMALVRNGSRVSLYTNGISSLGYDGWNTNTYDYLNVSIGRDFRPDSGFFQGYVSNLRISTSASAIYRGASFTVPTSPLDVVPATRLLAKYPYNTFTSTISISTASPFGNLDSSLYFNGSSDFIRTDVETAFRHPEYQNIVDFNSDSSTTIEMWVYPQAFAPTTPVNTIMPLIGDCNHDYPEALWVMGLDKDGFPTVKWMADDTNVTYPDYRQASGNLPVTLNRWNHLAYQLNKGVFRFYVNGELASMRGTVSATDVVYNYVPGIGLVNHGINSLSSSGQLTIGKYNNLHYKGYLSNVRVVKNNCLYNTNFIGNLPSKPFDLVAGTSFLLKHPYTNYAYTKNVANLAILSGTNYQPITIKNSFFTYASGIGQNYTPAAGTSIAMDSIRMNKFSVISSTVASYYSDISLSANSNKVEGNYLFNACRLGNFPVGYGVDNYQTEVYKSTGIVFNNYNGVSGFQITYLNAGTRTLDYRIYLSKATRPSERLTPSSANTKIRSGSKYVALKDGQNTTIKVYVRKSTLAADGVDYNGSNPRLILRKNAANGIMKNIELGVWDGYNDLFISREVTTPNIVGDGVLEFYVDCDGTRGFINIDNWTSK